MLSTKQPQPRQDYIFAHLLEQGCQAGAYLLQPVLELVQQGLQLWSICHNVSPLLLGQLTSLPGQLLNVHCLQPESAFICSLMTCHDS